MLELTYTTNERDQIVLQPSEESLEALAQRLRHSDHAAFEAIFRRMNEPLLRYAYRFVHSKTLALDVLQDIFLKLWEKRESIEIKISLSALLYTMTRYRALNMNREAAKYANEELTPEPGVLHSEHIVAESNLAAQQMDAFFKTCIKELPPRQAEAFILSRFHDLTHREIGVIMGLSKRTVDTHIVYALRHLRARYEAHQAKGISP